MAQIIADQVFGILNLGHWDLFEIWFLVLGIFMIFTRIVAFVNSVNYLFNDVALEKFTATQAQQKAIQVIPPDP